MRDVNLSEEISIAATQSFKEKDYWLKQLSGEWLKCYLPYDYQYTTRATFNAGIDTIEFKLPPGLSTGLTRLSGDSNPRLHMILVAAAVLLLYKYTGNIDIIVGTAIDKQDTGRESDFINTILPLRQPINRRMTFKELLLQVRQTVIDAIENQNYPMEAILNHLNLKFSESDFPLFDLVILLENIHDKKYLRNIKPNIVFVFSRVEESIQGKVDYNPLLFHKQTIKRIFGHFNSLLQQGLVNVDLPLGDIEILSEKEKKQQLYDFNGTEAPYPKDKTIHRLFEERVVKNPDSTAVVDKTRHITYNRLNKKSHDLACFLKGKGVRSDVIVGIMVERSLEMIIGVLGILKAGGAYLPIDPDFPAGRIDYMLADCAAKILLARRHYAGEIKFDREILEIAEVINHVPTPTPPHLHLPPAPATCLAYVIYTSGSTGKPKGVMIDQPSLVNYICWAARQYVKKEALNFPLYTSISFDLTVTSVFTPLVTGNAIVIYESHNKEIVIRQVMAEGRVGVVKLTPAHLKLLNPGEGGSTVKGLIVGGEELETQLARETHEKFKGDTEIYNEYGPTEAAVGCMIYKFAPQTDNRKSIPLGTPADNTRVYILGKGQTLLPPGVHGELFISGIGLARGYLNQPELTGEKFVPNPFLAGERMYRTGDLARWLTGEGLNLNIEFLGRIDQQVKIRGFRIEPGEIACCLEKHQAVKQAVVMVNSDHENNKYLCAYLVAAARQSLKVSEIRMYLAMNLPAYMMPSRFVELEQVPLTSNGKIDRKALSEIEPGSELDTEYIGPRDEVEEKLVEIWRNELEMENVGVKNNFFVIGGDSIKSIRLISLINETFAADLKIIDLFENRTVEELADKIRQDTAASNRTAFKEVCQEIVRLKIKVMKQLPKGVEDLYPMTEIQKGMIYYSLKLAGDAVYHNQALFQIKDDSFDRRIFAKALGLMVEKHSMLRTGFDMYDFEKPIQIVHKEICPDIKHWDLANMEAHQQEEYLRKFMEEDRKNPFDIRNALPLWRMRTFALGQGNVCILWIYHHAMIDGWSNASLMTEFNNTYLELKTNPSIVTEKLKSSYKEYVIEQMLEIRSSESLTYWQQELSDHNRLDFFGTGTHDAASGDERTVEYDFAEPFRSRLEKAAVKHKTNVKETCFAAYVYMLNMLSWTNDVVVGLVSDTRPTCEDGDKIIGCFLNTVPVRIKIPAQVSCSAFIDIIKSKLQELKRYDHMPLLEIVNVTGEKNTHRNPFFDSLFNFVDFHIYNRLDPRSLKGEDGYYRTLSLRGHERTNTLFDVSVNTTLGGFKAILCYSTSVIAAEMVERLFNYFKKFLEQFIDAPGKLLDKDGLLSEAEKKKLLVTFNETSREIPTGKTLPQLFAEQVDKNPDHVAVTCSSAKITYRELNNRSQRLTYILRKKGVKPGVLVGLMVNHSVEMIIGIMAILKSGGTYLPIDPTSPRQRILTLLNDGDLTVLLTHSKTIEKHAFYNLQRRHTPGRGISLYLTPPRPPIANIDDLSIPDRSLVNYEKYHRYIGQSLIKHSISMLGSRGCPFHCAYCHKIWPDKQMTRSAEKIFAEVKLYYDMGVHRFVFLDDVFNLDVKNTRRFFQLIIEKGLDVQLSLCLRGDILTHEYIDLMVKAGTLRMALALETASPRLQKLVGKNLNLEKFRENLEYICKTYPQVILELNTMHGFPGETEAEAMMTLEFIKRLRWLHFPYVNILKIYQNTDMERLALQSGISAEAILRSADLAYHELPETLPFDKRFTLMYQSEFLKDYFLAKERLLQVLPYQARVLTEDELVQKYNSYLPVDIRSFDDLLEFTGISAKELGQVKGKGDKKDKGEKKSEDAFGFLDEKNVSVPGLNEKLKTHFNPPSAPKNALRILLLDLSQLFAADRDNMLYDVVEPPLGLMYIMTHLKREFADQITGKIAKSRIDFEDYKALKCLLAEFAPDVIGIRTLTYYRNFFHRTIAMIRQWGFDVPIIAGGPYATSDYKTILQDANVDLVVLGEGEITLAHLIRSMLENKGKLPGFDRLKNLRGLALVQGKTASKSNFAREILMMDVLDERLPAANPENVRHYNHPSDPAYVIFTSGSTGQPKGVMVEHRNVANLVRGLQEVIYSDFKSPLQVSLLSPYVFDASVKQIFGALLLGHNLHIVPQVTRVDGEALLEFYNRCQIDVTDGTPAHLQILLESINGITCPTKRKATAGSVKRFIIGGDVLPHRLVKDFLESLDSYGPVVTNIYGPTECTVDVTSYHIARENNTLPAKIPIGRPMANHQVYILDGYHKIQPVGAAGELCVTGRGVARGYLNRPEPTAEKFTRAVLRHASLVMSGSLPGSDRLYKTGDLGRWLEDGNIEFLGRKDAQVKINGFRIEPGEIENRLMKIPGIKQAVVVAKEEKNGGKYLCAYLVGREAGDIPESPVLKDFLSEILPGHMIPSYFIRVDHIPLTPNGKFDKKRLPDPGLRVGNDHVLPRTKTEKQLVEIWSEVLGLEREKLSIDANFFDLGGHSLKATLLSLKIHKTFNVKVPLAEVFRQPFIRGQAQYIKHAGQDLYAAIVPVEKKEYYALSPAQKRLYILQQLELKSTVYNMPQTIPLQDEAPGETLEKVFIRLIERHESLRTSYLLVEGKPVQKVHEREELEFNICCYEIAAEQTQVTLESFVQPFDLGKPPLVRVGFVKVGSSSWLLLIDMHHITTDGISQEILKKEFIALAKGEEMPLLSPLRLQYKDYSGWQNSGKYRESLSQQEVYWINTYSGQIPVLNLPIDYPRPLMQSFAGSSVNFLLKENETHKLKTMAKEADATLYMVILSLFTILLAKLSGQEDILVGTPIAARKHADLEHIIGMFVNTLVIRNYPAADKTFSRFLAEVKEQTLDAFENQEYQFEDLVEKVAVRRDTGRNPLFDVMFNLLNQADSANPSPIIDDRRDGEAYRHRKGTAKFDLNLAVLDLEERLLFHLEYCTRLFKANTIERIIGYFRKILVSLLNSDISTLKLSGLEIVTEDEKAGILSLSGGITEADDNGLTIHRLFEAQASQSPDSTAVVGMGHTVSYGELNRRANRLAHRLRKKGVKQNTLVGLMVGRSVEMVTGILAIMKAGGAYLPIDTQYPAPRKKYMLQDSRISLLLTDYEIEQPLNFIPAAIEVIPIGSVSTYIEDDLNPPPINNGADLVYVIYTSGSTGRPKGVLLEHRNLVNLIRFHHRHTDIDSSRVLQFATISFDASFHEIFSALLCGGTIFLIDQETRGSIYPLFKTIADHEIKTVFLPMSFLRVIFNQDDYIAAFPGCVRHIQTAGEQVVVSESFRTYLKENNIYLHNHYGPSETHVVTALTLAPRGEIPALPTIGKPIRNTSIYIIDKGRHLLPQGVPGELCIGGIQVGKGYLNRPELTAERFTFNRFNFGHQSLLYHSGDLSRWDAAGNIEFLGRIDHMVKIRGFRVETGEIESQLLDYPGISESVVLAKTDETGNKYLCAYVVAGSGKDKPDTAVLRQFLSGILPDYMVPAYFTFLEQIPLTTAGKVDRSALPTPRLTGSAEYIMPANPVEEKLVGLWAEVLGIEPGRIGRDSHFFELGGHSLKATMLAAAIHKAFNVQVPLAEVFKGPTIGKLAEYLDRSGKTQFIPIEAAEKKEFYELSYDQKRLWIIQQLEPGNPAYNLPGKLELPYPVKEESIKNFLYKLLERHGSFRTCFKTINHEVFQFLLAPAEVEIPIKTIDISSLTGEEQEQKRRQLQTREHTVVFELSQAPLLRVVLVKLGEERFELLYNMHHIISDGWSMELLKQEFALAAPVFPPSPALQPLRIGYTDYARWHNRLLTDNEWVKKALEFWKKKLSGTLPVLSLPFDSYKKDALTRPGAIYRILTPELLAHRLRNLAKQKKSSLFILLLSAFYLLLSRLSGQDDIMIGGPVAGREHEELKPLVGFFINTMIFRNTYKSNESFSLFWERVHENVIQVLDYQGYPLELACGQLQVKYPEIPVFFNMLNMQDGSKDDRREHSAYHSEDLQPAKFDLQCYIKEFKNGIEIRIHYRKELFKPFTIERIMQGYVKILENIAENPDRTGEECLRFKKQKQRISRD